MSDFVIKNGVFANYTGKDADFVIPEGVYTIFVNAFLGCNSLESVTIPESVKSIHSGAFQNCFNLKYNEYDNALYLGNKNNPYMALIEAKDTSITSVEINKRTRVIADGAFLGCDMLKNVTMPDSIRSIDAFAFLKIHYSYGDYTFSGCDNIKYNEYGNALYLGNENNPYVALIRAKNTSVNNIYINEKTNVIAKNAFVCCKYLKNVNLPENVKLTSVPYPSTSFFSETSEIQFNAFGNALYLGNEDNPYVALIKAKHKSIKGIIINDKTKLIADEAFLGCDKLINVTMPDSIRSICASAFSGCDNIKYNEYDNALYLGNATNPYLVLIKAKNTSITSVEINKGTNVIAEGAFYGCNSLNSVVIQNGVTTIGESAFIDSVSLTSVSIPDSVIAIGDGAFSGCSGLESVTMSGSLTEIGRYAFCNCSSLTSVTIPDSLTEIGSNAFEGCSSLINVTMPENTRTICSGAFKNCSNLESVVFSKKMSKIAKDAFEGCSNLREVTVITVDESRPEKADELAYDGSLLTRHKFVCPYCGKKHSWLTISCKADKKALPDIDGYCPDCKKPLSFEPEYYCTEDGGNEDPEYPKGPDMDHKVSEFVDARIDDGTAIGSEYDMSDPEKLTEFLKCALELESSMEVLTNLLNKAYCMQYASGNVSGFFEKKLLETAENERISVAQRLENIETVAVDENVIEKSVDKMMLPSKPVKPAKPKIINIQEPVYSEDDIGLKPEIRPAEEPNGRKLTKPTAPEEPFYEKPGFFNKKKVLAQNEEKKSSYQKALASYEEQLKEYNRQTAIKNKWKKYRDIVAENEAIREKAREKYNKELAEYKEKESKNKQLEEEYERAVKRYEAKIEEFNKKKEKAKADEISKRKAAQEEKLKEKEKLEKDLRSCEKKIGDVKHQINDGIEELKYKTYWDLEVEKIQNQLSALIQVRNELYSTNILYGKYRHLSAISTIYEYIESGRCSKLKGPDGAYNLYENETRADMVIDRLDNVLVSLDAIKNNQFVLIDQLKGIQRNIKEIGRELISSLDNIDDRLADVRSEIGLVNKNIAGLNKTVQSVGAEIASSIESGMAEMTAAANETNYHLSNISSSSNVTAAMSTVSAAANLATAYNTRQIAYNTAETAFYSKVNAQLQHTANFLIALK